MKRLVQDLAYTVLVAGTLLGFLLGIVGGMSSGTDPVYILWKAALGACFGAFLTRMFIAVVMLTLRQNPSESSAENEEPADINPEARTTGSAES